MMRTKTRSRKDGRQESFQTTTSRKNRSTLKKSHETMSK